MAESKNKYYDGTKIMSLTDINGEKPELYLISSNRTAGKTTFFGRFLVNRWFDKKEKFALIYRFNYELDGCGETFFKDIGTLFFRGHKMESKKQDRGMYAELLIDGKCCGYALSLNSADQIKKKSHLFSDVQRMLMDEFQSETNHYCDKEIEKFLSIHTSVARGQNKQRRYVPVYMLSNQVSILNPYYTALGISGRLRSDTKYLRGSGFVVEQAYNESAANAQAESGINKAFSNNKYVQYSVRGNYLNDNIAFIERPTGKCRYLVTIRCDGKEYAVREYGELGILYCDNNTDTSFKGKICTTTDDHNINYVMLARHNVFIVQLRDLFEKGCFRFKNLECKNAILKTLSY